MGRDVEVCQMSMAVRIKENVIRLDVPGYGWIPSANRHVMGEGGLVVGAKELEWERLSLPVDDTVFVEVDKGG